MIDPETRPYVEGTVYRAITDTAGAQCGAIYDKSEAHRYLLWRIWEPDHSALVCIGLNPSTATELVLDPTLRRDLRYAKDWGYGGIIKLNLFSFRSTDPKALYGHEPNVLVVTGGVTNDEYLAQYTKGSMTLCAWGTHGSLYDRGVKVQSNLRKLNRELWIMGLCRNGEPKHTLYLPAS